MTCLHDAVLVTARCMTANVLTDRQLKLLEGGDSRMFLTGPPGSGKTLMLTLKALSWLQQGHVVYILVLWNGNEAVSLNIRRQILELDPSLGARVRIVRCSSPNWVVDFLKEQQEAAELAMKAAGLGYPRGHVRRPVGEPFSSSEGRLRETTSPCPERSRLDEAQSSLDVEEATPDGEASRLDEEAASLVKEVCRLRKEAARLREEDARLDVEHATLGEDRSALPQERPTLSEERSWLLRGLASLYEERIRVMDEQGKLADENIRLYKEQAALSRRLKELSFRDEACPLHCPLVGCHVNSSVTTPSNWSDLARAGGGSLSDYRNRRRRDPKVPLHPQAGSFMAGGDRDEAGVKIIVDEAPWFFDDIYARFERELEHFDLWAASSFHGFRPERMREFVAAHSLRCPPVVVRELEKSGAYKSRAMHRYATPGRLPQLTDGPEVMTIRHSDHDRYRAVDIADCRRCADALADLLTQKLFIGNKAYDSWYPHKDGPGSRLYFRDVVISGHMTLPPRGDHLPSPDVSHRVRHCYLETGVHNDLPAEEMEGELPGFFQALVDKGIPLQRVRGEDTCEACRLGTRDAVLVAEPETILGLERTVVVVLGQTDVRDSIPRHVDPWFDVIACCTSQLVVVKK